VIYVSLSRTHNSSLTWKQNTHKIRFHIYYFRLKRKKKKKIYWSKSRSTCWPIVFNKKHNLNPISKDLQVDVWNILDIWSSLLFELSIVYRLKQVCNTKQSDVNLNDWPKISSQLFLYNLFSKNTYKIVEDQVQCLRPDSLRIHLP